jgi:hypothetical protein
MAAPMTEADDASLIASLAERGCDLTKQREVGVHFHASSPDAAGAIARELSADGWADPAIFDIGDEWVVAAGGKWIVVSDANIAEVRRISEDLASRTGVTYHGWQARLDPGMDVE